MATYRPLVLVGGKPRLIDTASTLVIGSLPIDTDGTLANNSNSLIATQKATKEYVDAKRFAVAAATMEMTFASSNITGNISSVDTTNNIITWSTTHGLNTGEIIVPNGGTWPAPLASARAYYVNALSTTTFAVYMTWADAIVDQNRIDLTSAGSSTRTTRKATFANIYQYGGQDVPIQVVCDQANVQYKVPFSPALASAQYMEELLVQHSTIALTASLTFRPAFSSKSTSEVVYAAYNFVNTTPASMAATWANFAGSTTYLSFLAFMT